jgi:7-cyano-7-deazaguanine synthase
VPADQDGRPVHVLVSGGIDSTACVDHYLRAGRGASGIFVDFGQAAAGAEWDATQRIAEHYAITVRRLAVDGGPVLGADPVYGRNGFLIFAALTLGGTSGAIIALGIHAGTDYYDCSLAFIDSIRPVVERCSGGLVSVEAPFADCYKSQIFDYARMNDVPLHLTYSCERGSVPPCGTCLSCGDVLIDHHRRAAAPYRQRG